jgi:hypothetical protein
MRERDTEQVEEDPQDLTDSPSLCTGPVGPINDDRVIPAPLPSTTGDLRPKRSGGTGPRCAGWCDFLLRWAMCALTRWAA